MTKRHAPNEPWRIQSIKPWVDASLSRPSHFLKANDPAPPPIAL
ncbi:hypothetical protein GLA29479_4586 [Lysobacter antibioticus]|nr:hypothetical protein GLA29479_4586 [Lysobacter antibioticus]